MALTLRVTSYQSQALGPNSVKVFGANGGSIGRVPSNDWVLPDPEKFVSGNHARVDCQNGVFVLIDTSTNGVYVNNAEQPIGNGMSHRLANGDRIQIGDYELSVSLEGSDQPSIPGAVQSTPGYGQDPFMGSQDPLAGSANPMLQAPVGGGMDPMMGAPAPMAGEPGGEMLDPLDLLGDEAKILQRQELVST